MTPTLKRKMEEAVYDYALHEDIQEHFIAGFTACHDLMATEIGELVDELKSKVEYHKGAYATDIFPDYTLKENPNPTIDQVGGKMGRHMCDVFLRYIDEALSKHRGKE